MNNLPYSASKIYISRALRGTVEIDKTYPWKLVHYLEANGAKVLDKRVVAVTKEDGLKLFVEECGYDIRDDDQTWDQDQHEY